ncbi:hypothetical protein [Aureimonas glaciei]|uniref:Uncharacterized protein n=1 Tax=Aureimonas glaciei TaxID=1776957 RepID=A0A917DBZ0_9HYPH|nr:hypothetical protein [Aureimonas glaciei]GGD24295.1 hypothetical protein GCM10011335_29030 [Aureimonas glaciei]
MDRILDSLISHAFGLVLAGVAAYCVAALVLELSGKLRPKRWKRILVGAFAIFAVAAQFAESEESTDRYVWTAVGAALGLLSAYKLSVRQQSEARSVDPS